MLRAQTRASLLGLALMLAAAPIQARELELYVESRLGGDSNVFRRAESTNAAVPDGQSAGVFELSPRVTLRERNDDIQYEVAYQPTYEQFFALSGDANAGNVSGVDHSARANLGWSINQADRLDFDASFFRQRRVREEILGITATDAVLDANDDEYVQRGRASLAFNHAFSRRTSASARYAYDLFDLSETIRSDTDAHTVSIGANHAVLPHTRVGLSWVGRFRSTKVTSDSGPRTEFRSRTRTFDLSASLNHDITRHWNVALTAGPSFIRTADENSIPDATSGSSSNNSIAVFASASTQIDYRRGRFVLAYTRSETGGGGTGAASSVFDDVTLRANYRPDRDWDLRVILSWNQRESLPSNVLAGLETDVERVSASFNVIRQITPRFSVMSTVRYATQEQEEYRPASPGFPAIDQSPRSSYVLGFVSLRYTFEPYVF